MALQEMWNGENSSVQFRGGSRKFGQGGHTDQGHFRASRQHHKKGQAGVYSIFRGGLSPGPPPYPPGGSTPEVYKEVPDLVIKKKEIVP